MARAIKVLLFAIKRAKTIFFNFIFIYFFEIRLNGSYGAEGPTDGRAALFWPTGPSCRLTAKSEQIKVSRPFLRQGVSLVFLAFWGGAWILDLMGEMGCYRS